MTALNKQVSDRLRRVRLLGTFATSPELNDAKSHFVLSVFRAIINVIPRDRRDKETVNNPVSRRTRFKYHDIVDQGP